MVLEFVLFPGSPSHAAFSLSSSAEQFQAGTRVQTSSKLRVRPGRSARASRSALAPQQPDSASCLSSFQQSRDRRASSFNSSATTSYAFELCEDAGQLLDLASGTAVGVAAVRRKQSSSSSSQHSARKHRRSPFASASSAFGPLQRRSAWGKASQMHSTSSSGQGTATMSLQGAGLIRRGHQHSRSIIVDNRKACVSRGGSPRHFASLILASAEAAMQQHYDYAAHQGQRFGRSAGRWATQIPDNVRRLVAGGVAGGVSKTVTAPIETVRLSTMAGQGSIMEIARGIWCKHGLLGFFSGNAADVIRVMPSKAIELAAFDAFKAVLLKKNPKTGHGRGHGNSAFLTGVAGGAAGVTATVAMFPLETVRTRLAMNGGQYKGILHALQTIMRDEGAAAFYRGLDASLIGVIPYAALRLGLYDGFKWSYRKVTGEQQVPASQAMIFGALAGLLSATATFPLEVVRRRMMLGTASGNTFKAVASIAAAEGWGSLYKGLALTWAKQVPQNAITFVAYDLSKQWLELQA